MRPLLLPSSPDLDRSSNAHLPSEENEERGARILPDQEALDRSEAAPEEFLDPSETPLIRVLAVEDGQMDLLLLEKELSQQNSVRFDLTSAESMSEAVEMLAHHAFDVVLTDLGLPDSTGLETFLAIKKAAKGLPVIVMTSHNDERIGIRAMREGAQDYFVKSAIRRDGLTRAIRDAIERCRSEENLRRSEERFRSSIDSLLDGFALLTPVRTRDGTIAHFSVDYVNASGQALLSAEARAGGSLRLEDLFPEHAGNGLFEQLVRVATLSSPEDRESVLLCAKKAGEHGSVSYDFRTARTESGIALSWRDVTQQLKLEAQLLQSEKMNSIGQLAGGIAHDFNNLLTVVHAHADMILNSPSLPRIFADAVREISAAAVRATNLTSQLLTFSRQQPMVATEVDINDTVTQMSNMIGRILGADIILEVALCEPPPFVRADNGMIGQILLNLTVNARDAMPEGGKLAISTCVHILGEVDAEAHPEVASGPFVCLTVCDTGCGIPAENLSRIFEPFFSTKDVGKGTGLGLSTVYGIVRQHQGWMKVQSSPGMGTCFQVYLPCHECKSTPALPAPEVHKSRDDHETILLVEDEAPIREIVKMFLEMRGYHVLDAANGPEALAIWGKEHTHIDLLLTDLVMPGGITGQCLAGQLQASQPDLKVIYCSGHSPELFGQHSFLNPETNFLQKPYRTESLAEMIRHCLDVGAACQGV